MPNIWVRRSFLTVVAAGATSVLLLVLVPSTAPRLKRLLTTAGSRSPGGALALDGLRLQPVGPAGSLNAELLPLANLWQDQTLVLHVMRRCG